jgi:hypothetical protein
MKLGGIDMNLVGSAILRGMVGASSHAEFLSIQTDNRRTKSRGGASPADGASEHAAASHKSSADIEDAREALKGVRAESGVQEYAHWQQMTKKWRQPRSGADSDAVELSGAGKSAAGETNALYAQSAAGDAPKSAAAGCRLSIKI